MEGKHCPGCGKDIGVWAIIKASLPSKIRCPHCKVALHYARLPWLWLAVSLSCALVLMPLAVATLYGVMEPHGGSNVLLNLLVMALIWLPFEVALAYRMRSRGTLQLKYKQGGE